MKLLYCTSIIFPSRRANRLQTIAMSKEFASVLGGDFYLGGSNINLPDGNNKFQVVNFKGTTKSPILAWRYFKFICSHGITHIYGREERLVFFLMMYAFLYRQKLSFVYEAHFVPPKRNILYYFTLKRCDGVVALTELMAEALEKAGIKTKMVVAPDGVDLKTFDLKISKADARKKIGLPNDKKIVLYSGHLYQWKGVHTLALAASSLPDALFTFVGGTEKDIESFRVKYGAQKNIFIAGYKDHGEIPYWLASADVLALPNTAKEEISKYFTSPLKLFEYMSSGVPIVASDIPSLREVLNSGNSIFVPPDDALKLGEAIGTLLDDSSLSSKIAAQAKKDALNYSWEKRREKIMEFIVRNTNNF